MTDELDVNPRLAEVEVTPPRSEVDEAELLGRAAEFGIPCVLGGVAPSDSSLVVLAFSCFLGDAGGGSNAVA